MGLIYEIRRRATAILLPALLICVASYFAYYAIQGERGMIAYFQLVDEIEQAEQAMAATSAERERLSRRVTLLKLSALDLDILDEQARRVLGLAHPDEVVIYEID